MAGHGMSIGWTVAVVRIPAEVRMTQSLDLELTIHNRAGGAVRMRRTNGYREILPRIYDEAGERVPYTVMGRRRVGEGRYGSVRAAMHVPLMPGESYTWYLELTKLFALEPGRYTLSVLPWVGTPARSNVKVNVDVEGVPFEVHPKPPRPQRLQRWDEDGRLLPVEVPWLGVD